MLAENHKRILRNTGMLYVRMLLVMGVTLYTSRVVLAVLGVEDFGIYHVVAGFVAMLGFMQGAMTTASQRYFAFDLGETGGKYLSRIFSTSLIIHAFLALLVALLAETIGYWFVRTQLTIPDARLTASLWAYHLAIASFAISVITVPFSAMLMAHERMGIFAVIGMLDVLFKLAAVIVLQFLDSDKLISYSGLLFIVSLTTFTLYVITNRILFKKIELRWIWHKEQFQSMLNYTAWNTWGNLAAALSGHGTNILLNIFFGPALNAAKSISAQANGALYNFVANVQAAINPQIIKLYASGDRAQMYSMVLHASKYNYLLLFTLALPFLVYTEYLLSLWLIDVPAYTTIFLKLTILGSLINSFSGPLMTSAQATGRIRLYQSIVGGVLLLNVPLSFLFLNAGYQPESVLVISVCLNVGALVARMLIVSALIKLSKKAFITKVLGRAIMVSVLAVLTSYMLAPTKVDSLLSLIHGSVILIAITLSLAWLVGLGSNEKKQLLSIAKSAALRFN